MKKLLSVIPAIALCLSVVFSLSACTKTGIHSDNYVKNLVNSLFEDDGVTV